MGDVKKVYNSAKNEVQKITPKIKVGDPGKLITKPIEGISNTASSVGKSVLVDPLVDLGSAAIGGAGKILSDPNAGKVLGVLGSAYGIPNLGNTLNPTASSATSYADRKADFGAPVQSNFATPSGGSNSMLYIILAAVAGIGLIFIIKRKK